jgi:hypothetical protein
VVSLSNPWSNLSIKNRKSAVCRIQQQQQQNETKLCVNVRG